ncbi:MAG: transporter substrate-binding domain-containing protein [Proteobacteria bacterium]|nr:transporter substrate-binding domain-containing protein [Pseudomonadota bacterium]MBU1058526.1 transporter substrate-binding domain-containing protein [Pseudomonadota bacterium]
MKKIAYSAFMPLWIAFLTMISSGDWSLLHAHEMNKVVELSPATLVLTDDEQEFLKKKGQITMCVDPDWMPLEKIEYGKHVGMTADYMALFGKTIPVPLVLVPTRTWVESVEYAKARKCDIFSLAMSTPERERYMDFTRPYLRIPLVMAARMERPFIDDITAITDRKLGVVKGYAFGELLRTRYPKMQIVEVENVDKGLQQVAEGDLYGFIGTLATVGYSIQKAFATELKVAGKFDERWELGVATRKDEPLLCSIFDKAIAAIDPEDPQRILNRWISVKYVDERNFDIVWQVMIFVGLGIVLLLYRNFTLRKYSRQLEEQNKQISQQSEQLQQTERQLLFTQYTVESCAFPILWVVNGKTLAETLIINANKASTDLLGYSHKELCALPIGDIDVELTEKSWKEWLAATSHERSSLSMRRTHRRKDGSTIPVDIFASYFEYHGQEYQFFFFIDASKEKRLQDKLHRSMKMEMIGVMAGGVAHDLNNILSGIVSYPELLLMKVPADSDLRKPLQAIHDSGKRAADVVADLLTVARGVAAARQNANLNTLIQAYLDSPEYGQIHSRHQEVECVVDLDSELLDISCSPVHVNKCLMNLIVNAIEAVGEVGHVWITTSNCYLDQPLEKNQLLERGEYVLISIADDGPGIGEEDLKHIFEPFYSKKVMGKSGTGLGLTVVWNSVQDHGGTIVVERANGKTVFTLYFPATRSKTRGKTELLDIAELQGNGEKILVVDDEAQQRDIAEKLLTHLGYQVNCVESGERAVEYVRVNQPDLIVLDMIMEPGMNGRRTYEEIRKLRPGQKAIVASGFSENEEVKKVQLLGARTFVKKPYTLRQIGLSVQETLLS